MVQNLTPLANLAVNQAESVQTLAKVNDESLKTLKKHLEENQRNKN